MQMDTHKARELLVYHENNKKTHLFKKNSHCAENRAIGGAHLTKSYQIFSIENIPKGY